MRSLDAFPGVSEQVAGEWVKYRTITCAKCNYPDRIRDNTSSGMNPDHAAKKFAQKGWSVGGTHVCRRCREGKKPMAPAARRAAYCAINNTPRAEPPAPIPEAIPMTAEIRTPTREDRRRVLDSVEEHWAGEGNCYRASFSDQVLAEKLAVPRKWVEDIREEFFGPDTNEAKTQATGRLAEIEKELATIKDAALASAEKAEALEREVGKLREKLKVAA